MTDRTVVKGRKFAHEILGLIAISALVALVAFLFLVNIAMTVAEVYCFENDVPMTEFDWMEVDLWIFGSSAFFAVCLFCVLFLFLMRDRIAYIRKITEGINAMRSGQTHTAIPLEGSNELTELADAINYMSAARQRILEKERTLAQEKEELIRSLSHDIRTPLTSVLAYSEYLATEDNIPEQERKAYLRMIRRKAEQIRDLTDILLDGSKRKTEFFEDGRLLLEQFAQEFEGELEDRFQVRMDLSGCGTFSGSFDVRELRRIFDNLSSNVKKYAEPQQPVCLRAWVDANGLTIQQKNAVRTPAPEEDGYGLGISSIRRIAQHYGGQVSTQLAAGRFVITVLLSDL